MKKGIYKVISVFSRREEEFDDYPYRQFYGMNDEKIDIRGVDEFASYVQADLNELSFRERLIETTKEIVTISLDEPTITSTDIQRYSGLQQKEVIQVYDSRPQNKDYDGIVVDLMLARSARRRHATEHYQPHGLGIVAWAVLHNIPVGIVYKDSGDAEFRQSNFWIEAILDTLVTHPMCVGNKIPSGNVNDVYREMRTLLDLVF